MGRWTSGERIFCAVAGGVLLCAALMQAYWRGKLSAGPADQAVFQPAPLPEGGAPAAYLRVHVTGAVKQPGVYLFGADDRVVDAVTRAGGAAPGARLNDLNLAAHLRDGLRLYVPGTGDGPRDEIVVVTEDIYVEEPPRARAPDSRPEPAAAAVRVTEVGAAADSDRPRLRSGRKLPPAQPVNLNTAGLDQLQQLPGVGETLARRIVVYRELHGRFRRPDELTNVSGIGDKTYARLAPYVTAD